MRTASPGKTKNGKTKNGRSKEDKKKDEQQTRTASEPEGIRASNRKEYGKLVSTHKEGT
jgi:hypothetical protein